MNIKHLICIFILSISITSCGGGGGNNPGELKSGGTLFSDNITIGSNVPTLIFLVGFTNQAISSPAATWAAKIFGTNDAQLNHYYNEVSGGSFSITAAVESQGTVNDGIVSGTFNTTKQTNYSVTEAANIVASILTSYDGDIGNSADIDFSVFDTNGDFSISRDELQTLFIFAGDEGATTGGASGVWAHATSFTSGLTIDGVVVARNSMSGGYAVFGEKQSGNDASIGIIAHELGHSLFNLPDLYDINSASAGIGNFGLMGGGSWNNTIGENAGDSPAHKTGYSKIKSGFITPTTLLATTSSVQVIATSQANHDLYKIMISNPEEYFLIENRDDSGYDDGMEFNGGLLITHIDENITGNGIASHRLVDVEEANNAELDNKPTQFNNFRGNANNLFRSGNQTDFDSTTTPNSNAYNGSTTGVDISNISAAGVTMTFDLTL